MNEERPRQTNAPVHEPPRRVTVTDGRSREALGDVARDVMDHVSMIVRDEAKIARLSVRRYTEHLREDVAPRALYATGAAVCGAIAAVCALVALFLALAWAFGSVPWAFAVFAALFALATGVMIGLVRRPRAETTEDITRRFQAAATRTGMPEHALARQATPERHREVTLEAEREASREILTPHPAVLAAEDQAKRMGAHDGERREVAPHHNGHSVPASRQPPG